MFCEMETELVSWCGHGFHRPFRHDRGSQAQEQELESYLVQWPDYVALTKIWKDSPASSTKEGEVQGNAEECFYRTSVCLFVLSKHVVEFCKSNYISGLFWSIQQTFVGTYHTQSALWVTWGCGGWGVYFHNHRGGWLPTYQKFTIQ